MLRSHPQPLLGYLFQPIDCPDSNGTTTTAAPSSSNSTLCGDECLNMTDSQYNLLYAIYAWTYVPIVIYFLAIVQYSVDCGYLNDLI